MPPDRLEIRTDSPPPARQGKSRSPWPGIVTAISLTCLVIAFYVVLSNRRVYQPPQPPQLTDSTNSSEAPPADAKPATAAAAAAAAAAEEIVDDPTGSLLWASPTTGAPLSLAYVPAGTQCLIHVRPSYLTQPPEGERVLAALGPWGDAAIDRLEAVALTKLADIEDVFISIVVTGDSRLDAVIRIELSEPLGNDELADRLDDATASVRNGTTYYVKHGRAWFLGDSATAANQAASSLLVTAPAPLVNELIDSQGQAPLLVRDIEALLRETDRERAATIVLAPRFLAASGNDLLTAEAAPLAKALQWLLGADAGAASLSVHFDDNFFAELRAAPTLNVSPHHLATKLQERLSAAPDAVEEMILARTWHPYGRKVLARFPEMLRALARYSRAAQEDRQSLVRCYLPTRAGHNLLMAGELLLTQPPSNAGPAEPAGPAQPKSIEERLATITSLTFAKETLERAIELLAEDIGSPIDINGTDLQLEGITKNQSFGIDLRRRPASEILVEVLRRANPDRSATGPADPRQKLVYVVEPGDSGGSGRIIVTTRTAAEKRGDRVAAPFLGKDR